MMTKTAFFALLNDKENRIGVTAHIAARTNSNGTQSLFIEQTGAPNAGLSNHKAHTATIAAFAKYNTWLNEWFMAQAAAAQARIDLLAEIEADHAEGEAVVAAINNDITVGIAHAEALAMNAEFDQVKVRRCRDAVFFGSLDAFGRRVIVEAAHGEALEMDKQATHFRREQSALTERVNKIMGKDTVVDMNKARQKQQQTPLNLPKPQMIDVLRAALRKTGNATDAHIEAVADMSEASMKKSLSGMLAKGARVTAYLTKSKSLGYGALTFGIDGQLPPGLYHAFRVGSMKEARSVAAQYGAMSWNF